VNRRAVVETPLRGPAAVNEATAAAVVAVRAVAVAAASAAVEAVAIVDLAVAAEAATSSRSLWKKFFPQTCPDMGSGLHARAFLFLQNSLQPFL
jgi:hypothetical protein